MKFWLSLVSVMEVDQLVEIAKYAEEVGFGGITCADHLVMPTRIDSKYPYTPDGEVFWRGEACRPGIHPRTFASRSLGSARGIARRSIGRCPMNATWICGSSMNHKRRSTKSSSEGWEE